MKKLRNGYTGREKRDRQMLLQRQKNRDDILEKLGDRQKKDKRKRVKKTEK